MCVHASNRPLSIEEVADSAARLLMERGHAKFVTQDDTGAMCIGGAILKAGRLNWSSPVMVEIAARLCRVEGLSRRNGPIMIDWNVQAMIDWNNDDIRTQEDVVLALKKVATGEGRY